jgi:hypothetical protein
MELIGEGIVWPNGVDEVALKTFRNEYRARPVVSIAHWKVSQHVVVGTSRATAISGE